VEVFKKKERHENIEEGGALSKRLVSQVDNRRLASKLGM